MKKILRTILTNLLVIYLVDIFYPGFSIVHEFKPLLTAAVIWFFLNKVIRPIIKLLLLPINLITLNLFSWVISVFMLFLLQAVVGEIKISAYQFPGVNFEGFVVPPIYINLFFSYIITSILMNSVQNFIKWLTAKDEAK